jgi:hypothetical protein
MPNKYRMKSFDIEAMQWDGTQEGATPIIDWVLSKDGTARWHEEWIAVNTRNPIGVVRALKGEWVVWMAQGGEADWATCSPENFEEAFEPVPA